MIPLLLAAVLLGATATAPPSVFADGQVFTCSSDAKVACSGVLPVRRSVPGERAPSEGALLTGGEEAFSVRLASLEWATKSIRVQALIFRGDEAGLMVADLLKRKKKAGVEVKVIVDAASNLDWQTQWMYFDLRQHGIEVEGYEALYLQWVTADLKPADPLRPNKRFHDKIWVVDSGLPGAVAIVGGRNIANEYFRIAAGPIDRWRDQDIALRGPIVNDVVAAFDRNYEYFKSIKGRLPKNFNPDNAWALQGKTLGRIAKVKVPSWSKAPLAAQAKALAASKVDLAYRPLTARFIQSRPRFEESYIAQAYLRMLDEASESILIANAYFVPSRQLSDALRRAVRRGVRVVILTNSPQTNDIAEIATVSRYLYQDLLAVNLEASADGGAAGSLEIREWRGAADGEGTLHSKFAVFDGKDAIIGSHNLDPRSDRLNSETVLAVRDAATAARLKQIFLEEDLPKSSPISHEQARQFRRPKDFDAKFRLLYSLGLREWL
ncbi:MAG: phospholipase D-like domain-containing protein [Myxococcaceae bacterium]